MSFRSILRVPSRANVYPLHSISRRMLATTSCRSANASSSNASEVISEVSKQEGGTYKGSTAAQLQSQVTKQRNAATANEQGAANETNTQLGPAEQSRLDREANYVEQADKVGTKLATEPENVTKEDANKMHSKEHKAFGNTEPGGIASQAQSLAAENAGDKK